jgi:flavin reductase (DIM6/NTAB) family NADH-FMN oxidoreductase RutF
VSSERCQSNPRGLFGRYTANVTVVTMCHQHAPAGFLVTSLASISTRPPLVSFSISSISSSWAALEPAEYIGLHFLAADQEGLTDRFSPGRNDGFTSTSWRSGPHGVPLLNDCAAWAVAQPRQRIHTGNHIIIVAELQETDARDDVAPLLTRADAYHHLAS